MRFLLTVLFSISLLPNIFFCQEKIQNSQSSPTQKKQEVKILLGQFQKTASVSILQKAIWTFTHDYQDFNRVEEVLKSFLSYYEAFEKYEKDSTLLEKLGGIKSFKNKFAGLLKDKDQSVRAFAAVVLGICGDKSYAPQIAVLLNKNNGKENLVYDRGRAAIALGLLDAKEYLPKILSLLKSKNQFDRQGAIFALESFGAKEYAKDIVNILIKNFPDENDPSPIYFLVSTGLAQNYKKELIQVMLSDFHSETSEAAMYALVKLNAKETAPEIAKLLTDEFKKGNAAKALALLDAQEFADEIATLLKDESGLVRCDAAIALGVLNAKKYVIEVSKLLNDKESFVQNYAAASILLMQAKEFYESAIPVVEKPFSENEFLTNSAFHFLTAEQTQQITARLKQNFIQAKEAK